MKSVGHSKSASGSEQTLCLTLNRSSQQERPYLPKSLYKDKLFSIRGRPPRFCRRNNIAFLHYVSNALQRITYRRLPCGSWTCPDCAPRKATAVASLLREIIVCNEMKYFLTLTLTPNAIPESYIQPTNRTHKYITKLFNTLLTNLRRKTSDLRYVWVVEFQKNGNAHLHIALNTRLNIVDVRAIWVRIGGGQQCRVERIKSRYGIAVYITKYLTKGLITSIGNLHYFERRYSISRSCIRPVLEKAGALYPDLSGIDLRRKVAKDGLTGVYNRLVLGDFTDGETVII